MSDQLALHRAQNELANAHDRFNALAQVAGREMARFIKPAVVPALTVGFAALGSAAEARFGSKGAIGNAVLAAIAYGVGFMSGENADLRWGAYSLAMGLGSAAASIQTYDKVTSMIAQSTAPAPVPQPAAP